MCRKQILFIDNVVSGPNHQTINSGIINTFQSLYEGQVCDFLIYGETGHLNALKPLVKNMDLHQTEFIPIKVTLPQQGTLSKLTSWYGKLKTDFRIMKSILIQAESNKPEFIVFQTLVASNLFFFKKLISQFPEQKFLLVLHGEIEYIFRKPRGIKSQINGLLYKKFFTVIPENLRFLVLSELIKQKLLKQGRLNSRQLFSIEHPLSVYTRPHTKPSEEIRLSHLGVANYRKGSHCFFQLAIRLKKLIESGKISMEIIGRIDLPETTINALVNKAFPGKSSLSQKEYQKYIERSTFAVSLIQGDDYIYRISGSLLDSIQYQLPLIALRHDYVNWLFELGGDIGYLCNSLDEMKVLIEKMASGKIDIESRYSKQVQNLKSLAKKFYPMKIAQELKEKILSS